MSNLQGYVTPHDLITRQFLDQRVVTGTRYRILEGSDYITRFGIAQNTVADLTDWGSAFSPTPALENPLPGLFFTEKCVDVPCNTYDYDVIACTAECDDMPCPQIEINEETLTANKVLVTGDPQIQVLNPDGTPRVVVLPDPAVENTIIVIVNNSDGVVANGNTITVQETALGPTLFTLDESTGVFSIRALRTSTQWILIN